MKLPLCLEKRLLPGREEFLCFSDFSLNISEKPDFARVVLKSGAAGHPEALERVK